MGSRKCEDTKIATKVLFLTVAYFQIYCWGKIAITNPKFSPLKIKAVASLHLNPDFCINFSFYMKPISMDLAP